MPVHRSLLFLAALMLAAPPPPPLFAIAQPAGVALSAPGLILRADRWDRVTINTPQGNTLLTLTGFSLKWTPALTTDGGIVRTVSNKNGSTSIEIDYRLPALSPHSVPPKVRGRFTPRAGSVDVVFTISGLPETIPDPDAKSTAAQPTIPVNLGGSMFGRVLGTGHEKLPAVKLGLWQRHEHGGLPSEHPDGRFIRHQIGAHIVNFAFDTNNKANDQWSDAGHQHTSLQKTSEGGYTTAFSILITPAGENWPPELLSARWHERPAGIKIGTTKTWNWWERATPRDPLALDIAIAGNTPGQTPHPVVVRHWIRDYAGNIVSESTRDLALVPGALHRERIPFAPSPTSPDPARDLFFAEVSIADKATGNELAFDRTHIALLPPHEFKSTPGDSILGLSAWWPIPDATQIARLLQRMGVRWLRQASSSPLPNITAILHDNINWKKDYTAAERDAWIHKEIKRCLDQGSNVWEFSNEINFASLNIGLGDTIKGEARAKMIANYIDWLKAIRRIQKQLGPPASEIKLLSTGLAGMDVKFVEALYDAGGWDLIDGLALHPGRGNFAVDYPVYDPPAKIDTWDDWKNWKLGAHGSYWNFYGSVITAKALIARYDAARAPNDPARKTLWLTEVYSPGHPNNWWEDTPRAGGENAILTLALAHAESVKAAFWYQLYDSVWHDKLGVNPHDREYSFGLIRRDLSFKPSLMGFCTAAEALDQAVFKNWIKFPASTNPQTRGLLFDTPRGPMAILWDRSDGYVLTKKSSPFPSPEPWIENWKTRTPLTVPVTGPTLTLINAIGQKQTLRASSGSATLTLTGAPMIVHGLDAAKLAIRE